MIPSEKQFPIQANNCVLYPLIGIRIPFTTLSKEMTSSSSTYHRITRVLGDASFLFEQQGMHFIMT